MASRKYNINKYELLQRATPTLTDTIREINDTLGDGGGGGGTPGGSNLQVQYNNNGAFGGISGVTISGTTINVPTPTADAHASTKLYVDNTVATRDSAGTTGNIQYSDGSGGFSAEAALSYDSGTDILSVVNITASGSVLVPTPTLDGQAVTKLYVDSALDFGSVNQNKIMYVDTDGTLTFNDNLSFTPGTTTLIAESFNCSGNCIVQQTPTAPTHATNKSYVDSIVGNTPGGSNLQLQYNDSGTTFGGATAVSYTTAGSGGLAFITGATLVIDFTPTLGTHAVNKTYVDGLIGTDVTWMLSSSAFSLPVIAYTGATTEVNTSGSLEPIILSGTTPIVSYAITSGSLPTGWSLATSTGIISYTNGAATSSGTFGVTATTPVGDSAEFIVSYVVQAAQGALQFFNTLNPYPFMRVTTSNSTDAQFLIKQTFYGRTTSASNGILIADSAYPIYAGSNGNGTWNYLVYPTGYSYWNFYANSTLDPTTLAAGLDIGGSSLAYDLVASTSNNVTLNSIIYPSDRSDIHWGSQLNYVTFTGSASDAAFNGFLTSDVSWQYGFKLEDAEVWLRDGMGKCMFNRDGRNYIAAALSHIPLYSDLIVGNNASRTSNSADNIPTAPLTELYVKVTYDHNLSSGNLIITFYSPDTVSAPSTSTVVWNETSKAFYLDNATASNSLDLQWGNGPLVNFSEDFDSYIHTGWQGQISRLWIDNAWDGVTSDWDDGTTAMASLLFPTASWTLSETTGSTFAAAVGGVAGTGTSNNGGGQSQARKYPG